MARGLLAKLQETNLDPLVHIQYVCCYWIDHLCQAGILSQDETGLYDEELIDKSLKTHFLHWLEALSLMGMMPRGVVLVRQLEILSHGAGDTGGVFHSGPIIIHFYRSPSLSSPLLSSAVGEIGSRGCSSSNCVVDLVAATEECNSSQKGYGFREILFRNGPLSMEFAPSRVACLSSPTLVLAEAE